jgi:hypothetical protein
MNTQHPVSASGVASEFLQALQDAQAMTAEYGNPVTFNQRKESEVTRDLYNSIASRAVPTGVFPFNVNAATISYNPTSKQLEKVGLREKCDVTIKCAVQDFMDIGVAFDDLETIRTTVVIQPVIPGESSGATYEVREKSRTGAYANGYLYYAFGLSRRG